MSNLTTKITLIGLGKMGSALAGRILQGNFPLTVYNRTASKMEPLIAAGAHGAPTLKEAVHDADIIVTCLLDDNAVIETVNGAEGFLNALKPGAIHVGTSTILPATSKALTQLHADQQSIYLAANVLGVPKVAERGELTTFVAGDPAAIGICLPLFNCYSRNIVSVGSEPYQANVMKICSNYLLATAIEAFGELYTFAEKSGLKLDGLNKFFHSVYAHPAYQLYADKIRERSFDDVNFDLKGGAKDLNLFQKAFKEVQVIPDIANVIKNKFDIAVARGMENKDWSAITEITRMQAGLEED